MTARDRLRWDERYASRAPVPADEVSPPDEFTAHESAFPHTGRALDLACGQGRIAVWLARRGMDVVGLDVSAVAITQARDLALRCGVEHRTRFDVADLDDGLPPGPPADVIVCHRFRDRRLDRPILARLASGGLLAVTALSEVGASPGPFRAAPGELTVAFGELEIVAAGEADGHAWLLGRHTSPL
ncbi:class I SAM-dependent methyltransferase [Mycobacterium sp. NPDC050041]|uniref:class I SAM-dependent methyltransferase n=1 Tax=Mycobacterium sp. NPDC050041 TaxID=3364293 RepID=UPI003C2DF8A5